MFVSDNAPSDTPLMRFLGDELLIENPECWNAPDKAKLFLYNVHYFDDLNADGAQSRQAVHDVLIERWIAENPAPIGNGWEPYPLSLRIVNWVKYFHRRDSVPAHWIDSLASQASFLSRKLEYHLLGNHLFTNAKALVFAGCYLQLQDAWTQVGLSILKKQLPEQVLSDGGHFELSPMYHCIAMADLLDLINLANSYPEQISADTRQIWVSTLNDMFLWLDRMRHPDGDISLFNDAALDIAPDYTTLSQYANSLGLSVPQTPRGVHHAKASGYVTVHNDTIKCMLDVGRIGPDYIPGHAHADSLGFEISLHGERLFCDSGTSEYGSSDERLRQRGTAAHNTVLIDQQNSSEVWSGFRAARRAYPVDVYVAETSTGVEVSASHTGYRRLKGKNTHSRHWSIRTSSMAITDTVSGHFDTASASFHIHPAVSATQTDAGIQLSLASGHKVNITIQGGHAHLTPSTWHPRFGQSLPSQKIIVPFDDTELVTSLSWSSKDSKEGT